MERKKPLTRSEKNRCLFYAKAAVSAREQVNKILAKRDERIKKVQEYYQNLLDNSTDNVELTSCITTLRAYTGNPDITEQDVIEYKTERKVIMNNECTVRTPILKQSFLETYCGVTTEAAESEPTSESLSEMAENVEDKEEVIEAEKEETEEEEVTSEEDEEAPDFDIPEDMQDDF